MVDPLPSDALLEALSDDLEYRVRHIGTASLVERWRKTSDADAAFQLLSGMEHPGISIGCSLSRHKDVQRCRRGDGGATANKALRSTARLALIAQKNWAEADRIRDELLAQGIQLKDGKDPVTGERVTTWEVKR